MARFVSVAALLNQGNDSAGVFQHGANIFHAPCPSEILLSKPVELPQFVPPLLEEDTLRRIRCRRISVVTIQAIP
jgi:hypothetical protein